MSDMPGMKMDDKKPGDMANMSGMKGGMKMEMSSVTNIGDPMSRESSGTSWAADSSPMYAKTKMYETGGMRPATPRSREREIETGRTLRRCLC